MGGKGLISNNRKNYLVGSTERKGRGWGDGRDISNDCKLKERRTYGNMSHSLAFNINTHRTSAN